MWSQYYCIFRIFNAQLSHCSVFIYFDFLVLNVLEELKYNMIYKGRISINWMLTTKDGDFFFKTSYDRIKSMCSKFAQ